MDISASSSSATPSMIWKLCWNWVTNWIKHANTIWFYLKESLQPRTISSIKLSPSSKCAWWAMNLLGIPKYTVGLPKSVSTIEVPNARTKSYWRKLYLLSRSLSRNKKILILITLQLPFYSNWEISTGLSTMSRRPWINPKNMSWSIFISGGLSKLSRANTKKLTKDFLMC